VAIPVATMMMEMLMLMALTNTNEMRCDVGDGGGQG
jgi:hypothetical protein